MMKQDSYSKILLVGLDGATFDLILPWVADGKLPFFARILSQGAHAPLRSTIPPVTPLAWSSLITGTNPGQHGIYGFISRKPGTYDWYATSATSRHGTSLWNWAGRHGRKMGVYNMPMTYPPEDIPGGYMISGMGVPDVDVQFTHPEGLQRDLLQRFQPEQLVEQPVSLYDYDTFLDYLLDTVDDNLSVIDYLLNRYPDTDLLSAVITATDRVQHFYWRQMNDLAAPYRQRTAIEQVYGRVDAALGELIERYPDRILLLMSDHGAGPYRHLINMNQWLAAAGWLRWKDSAGNNGTRRHGLWRRAYHRLGHSLPGPIRRTLKRLVPKALMTRARSEMTHWTLPVVWEKTVAYSAGFGGNLYLNLRDREPLGQVMSGAEAERLLEQIESALYELRDPETGVPVVHRVHRGADLYRGDRVAEAPDLVISWNEGYYSMAGLGRDDAPVFGGNLTWPDSEVVHTAEHRPYGIFMAYGPNVVPGAALPEASILDLAPTLVHLLALAIPSTMEGRVLMELLDASNVGQPRVISVLEETAGDWQTAYSPEEEEHLQDRLRSLGYLD